MTLTDAPEIGPAIDLSGCPQTAGPHDRRALALLAVERTRMPMVVADARAPDRPIILANGAFLDLTGYALDEVVGRNCRFLQGPGTDPATIAQLRDAVAEGREITVELLNYRKDGSPFWNQLFVSPIHDDNGAVAYHFASQLDISERREAQELEATERRLLLEVDHRAKNALALVQGIVRLSRADDPVAYQRAVADRVDSLAKSHAMLAERGWRPVALRQILHCQSEPFGARRLSLDGPEVEVDPTLVQPVGLVVYELLSNARGHGALSTPGGTIAASWWEDASGMVTIDWRERGGPPPTPERAGFGATMIDAIVTRQLRGRIARDWTPDGLSAEIRIAPQRA